MAHQPSQPCNVCGSAIVQVDEVFAASRLVLCECSRCRHRWTFTLQAPVRTKAIRVRRVAADIGTEFGTGIGASVGTREVALAS
jgi:hypothetical protein